MSEYEDEIEELRIQHDHKIRAAVLREVREEIEDMTFYEDVAWDEVGQAIPMCRRDHILALFAPGGRFDVQDE